MKIMSFSAKANWGRPYYADRGGWQTRNRRRPVGIGLLLSGRQFI